MVHALKKRERGVGHWDRLSRGASEEEMQRDMLGRDGRIWLWREV